MIAKVEMVIIFEEVNGILSVKRRVMEMATKREMANTTVQNNQMRENLLERRNTRPRAIPIKKPITKIMALTIIVRLSISENGTRPYSRPINESSKTKTTVKITENPKSPRVRYCMRLISENLVAIVIFLGVILFPYST